MDGKPVINLQAPHQKQAEVLQSEKKRIVLNWGRRSGKSFIAGEKTAISALVEQGTYYIIAPTIGNAEKIYWDQVLKTIFKDSPLVDKQFARKFDPKNWNEVGFNENEKSVTIDYLTNAKITLPNGKTVTVTHDKTKPRSKIVLYGATEPDNILGIGLRGVVLDECAKMPNFNYVWRKVIRPMLGDYKGWAVHISTPLGIHNPWFEYVTLAKANKEKYFYSHATAYDNPFFPNEEIEEAREDAIAAGELHIFEQEWLAQFVNPQGAIFPEFDIDKHTFNIKDLPKKGDIHLLGCDFGFSPDPAAILCARIDYDGRWWVYSEDYDTHLDDDRVANLIKSKMMDTQFTRQIGDGQRKDSIELLRRVYRIPMVASKKGPGSIKAGISQIHGMLRLGPDGEPKLKVASHLTNTIREFQSYSRKRDASGNFYDVPEDKNNHTIDALRYMLNYLQPTEQKMEERTAEVQKKYDPVTGRPLN